MALGVDRELAHRFVVAAARAGIGEAGPVALATGRSVAEAVQALDLVDRAAAWDRLVDAVDRALAVVPAPEPADRLAGPGPARRPRAWRRGGSIAALAGPTSIPARPSRPGRPPTRRNWPGAALLSEAPRSTPPTRWPSPPWSCAGCSWPCDRCGGSGSPVTAAASGLPCRAAAARPVWWLGGLVSGDPRTGPSSAPLPEGG